MRIGIVCYWFNRGQAVVGRQVRAALTELGHETFVLARPTTATFVKPGFVDGSDVWNQDGVTAASAYNVPLCEYLDWSRDLRLDVVFFDQNLQFEEIAALRSTGVRTIGRFVWESFGPDDVAGARRAFDIVYSMTACERRRYRGFGIDTPQVHWCPPPELAEVPRPVRDDGEIRFLYPGGYLSDRKPTAETIDAFVGVPDPRARLLIKVQDEIKGPRLAAEAAERDPRIRVIVGDLPTPEHHALLASVDAYVAPSRWEGLGLHLYEAPALGLPTITNDFPPMNEMVTHDVDGLLVPARWNTERRPGVPRLEVEPDDLREAMTRMCDDDVRLRLALGAAARGASFDWSRTLRDYADLLRRARVSPP
jgi:1,2-diacylglycerol 3-alpha-glucosyltransferase